MSAANQTLRHALASDLRPGQWKTLLGVLSLTVGWTKRHDRFWHKQLATAIGNSSPDDVGGRLSHLSALGLVDYTPGTRQRRSSVRLAARQPQHDNDPSWPTGTAGLVACQKTLREVVEQAGSRLPGQAPREWKMLAAVLLVTLVDGRTTCDITLKDLGDHAGIRDKGDRRRFLDRLIAAKVIQGTFRVGGACSTIAISPALVVADDSAHDVPQNVQGTLDLPEMAPESYPQVEGKGGTGSGLEMEERGVPVPVYPDGKGGTPPAERGVGGPGKGGTGSPTTGFTENPTGARARAREASQPPIVQGWQGGGSSEDRETTPDHCPALELVHDRTLREQTAKLIDGMAAYWPHRRIELEVRAADIAPQLDVRLQDGWSVSQIVNHFKGTRNDHDIAHMGSVVAKNWLPSLATVKSPAQRQEETRAALSQELSGSEDFDSLHRPAGPVVTLDELQQMRGA